MRAKISRHRVENYSAQLCAPRGCPLWEQQMRQVLSATPPNRCVISGQAEKISVAAKFILPGLFGLVSTGLLPLWGPRFHCGPHNGHPLAAWLGLN